MLRYYGFATRDYLILENIRLQKDSSVLEIGVGTGSTTRHFIGKVKYYCGVDISKETIKQLITIYKKDKSVGFYVADVCKDINIGKKFDIIFSADTLEHVEEPGAYFYFIKKHLNSDGVALITFPNESEKKHHGITWFDKKEDLVRVIEESGLEILDIYQVKKTNYHRLIEYFLWKLPKSIMSRKSDLLPQSFEDTQAFEVNDTGGIKANLFAIYSRIVTRFAACFTLYKLSDNLETISDKVLLMHLKHKSK